MVPIPTGISLITVLPEQLQSPLLTADWEYRLQQIRLGEASADDFITDIADMMKNVSGNQGGGSSVLLRQRGCR